VRWGGFKEETKNNIIDLRSTLINAILKSENVIVAEVSKPIEVIISHPINADSKDLIGVSQPLFEVFDKIKKLNGNLFHFGKCTKVTHNSEDKVIDLLRNSTIYVSIYLRVRFTFVSGANLMFYVTKNHERGPKSAILVATVNPNIDETRLVRLHGKLRIKSPEDLTLNVFLLNAVSFEVMDKLFSQYILPVWILCQINGKYRVYVVNALEFTGGNFIFSLANKHGSMDEIKRHNKAIEELSKKRDEWTKQQQRELLKREQKSVGHFKDVSYATDLYHTMTEEQKQQAEQEQLQQAIFKSKLE